MRVAGVKDVGTDVASELVTVTFDARKTYAPDLHDIILKSGYKPGPMADWRRSVLRHRVQRSPHRGCLDELAPCEVILSQDVFARLSDRHV